MYCNDHSYHILESNKLGGDVMQCKLNLGRTIATPFNNLAHLCCCYRAILRHNIIFLFFSIALDLPASPEYAIVKIHILLLLSVITKHSDKGYQSTINAFDSYKVSESHLQ